MATPLNSIEDDAILSDSSTIDDLLVSPSIRKRSRESLEDSFEDNIWDTTDDGRPKTRRVNPQRLAIRLGPELVAEMEALIVPGAKMPTFAVRKDFQERYCVDRRHIYDYFHSRGLRVAKEDKHTNLIRGRAMKAQAQLQAQQAQTEAAEKVRLTIYYPRKKPRKVFLDVPKNEDATGQPSYLTSSSGTDTEWETCPQFTLSPGTAGNTVEENPPVTDFLNSPEDFVAGYFDTPMDVQRAINDMDANAASNDLHSLMLIEDQNLLHGHLDGLYSWDSYSSMAPYAPEIPGTSIEKAHSGHTAKGAGTKGLNIASYLAADYPEFCRWLTDDSNMSPSGALLVDCNPASTESLDTLSCTGAFNLLGPSVALDSDPDNNRATVVCSAIRTLMKLSQFLWLHKLILNI
ncbi:hypothetical protein CVT24_008656 [Panaeolus cyanescens]|uniref:Uncharacterized protein n=1 Tax=Panaeolus cyanescens TaxID=181874 RepID=A0A409VBB0_9AGAR|nr:hypothetical protein CVT24_008656 [Panaeolus cyanescens]